MQLVGQDGLAQLGPRGVTIAAAEGGDDIWVTAYHLPTVSVDDPRQFAVVQRVDPAGHAVGPARRLPRGSGLIRGVRGGLLLFDDTRQAATALVWNPVTRRTTLGIPGQVLAATENLVAWHGADCSPAACSVHLTDLTVGGRRDYANPAGQTPQQGAISPDGRRLALTEYGDPSPGEPGVLTSVAVTMIDLRTGSSLTVPRSKIDNSGPAAPGYAAVGWSPDGRYVVLQASRQPALWAVGAPELWLTRPLPEDTVVVPS